MKILRKFEVILVAVLIFAFLEGRASADEVRLLPKPEIACNVPVDFDWREVFPDAPSSYWRYKASFDHLFDTMGSLLQEKYEAGGYVNDPLSFPVGSVDYEGDVLKNVTFRMKVDCDEAFEFVREILDEYKRTLSSEQAGDAPVITIGGQRATNHKPDCAAQTGASNCGEADSVDLEGRLSDSSESPPSSPKVACHVPIVLDFNESVADGSLSGRQAEEKSEMFLRPVAYVLQDIFEAGGYASNPQSFPVHSVWSEDHFQQYDQFEQSGTVNTMFNMRLDCDEAFGFVREVLDSYELGLSPDQAADAPVITLADQPGTKYQALCGMQATASSCPEADRYFPD